MSTHSDNSTSNNPHEEEEASRQRHQFTLRGLAADQPPPPVAARPHRAGGSAAGAAAISNTNNNPQAALRQQAHPPAPAVVIHHNPPSQPQQQQPQRGVFAPSHNEQQDAPQFVGRGLGSLRLGDNNNNNNNPELQVVEEEDSSNIGWSEVETNGVPPSARSLHSASLLNGVLYVFGGYDGSQRVNSFHAYSFVEKRWSPVRHSNCFNDIFFLVFH